MEQSDADRSELAVVPISNAVSSGALHTASQSDRVKTTNATLSNTMRDISSSGEWDTTVSGEAHEPQRVYLERRSQVLDKAVSKFRRPRISQA